MKKTYQFNVQFSHAGFVIVTVTEDDFSRKMREVTRLYRSHMITYALVTVYDDYGDRELVREFKAQPDFTELQ